MHHSTALSAFTMMCDHHHYLVAEFFITPNGNPVPVKQSLRILPSLQPLANNTLLSAVIDLPTLDISYEWNSAIRGLLFLASVFLELRAMKGPRSA